MVRMVFRIDEQALAAQLTGPQGILLRVVARMSRRIQSSASQRAPVDTGNLRRMIREDPITVSGTHVYGGVTSHAKYSRFVHDGTSPHIIRPRHKKALRFTMEGRPVIVRQVRHPGTRARPFLLNAAIEEVNKLGGAP
ncbi:HK97 gp10 family phage protein [Nocardia otitidiscaviarum]|uniref:HK97 gp10 family phage protein n=1 Tax=Nocardia otitidiscaviarum TaxID=1823 RepID=UPI0005BD0A64|nr:HK97 gp10 family phage protein [Nocardia otitidiscaviarum]